MTDRTVKCRGSNSYGQLGDNSGSDQFTPVEVPGLTDVAGIGGGESQTCATLMDGSMKCWGFNGYNSETSTPVDVQGLGAPVVAFSVGADHTCAILNDQTAWCWGSNSYGQLGDGTQNPSSNPVEVQGLTSVSAISSGYFHTCAAMDDGTVKCWGANNAGQVGKDTFVQENVPVAVQGLSGATGVSVGEHHSCALTSDGSVHCWGSNRISQLGLGGLFLVPRWVFSP